MSGDEECHPDPKRARLIACEEAYETLGSLGRMTFKRSGNEECYRDPKRARLIACEEVYEAFGSLGTTTWKECHEEDEDILVLDVDNELLEEMDSLLREMKL